MTTTPRLRTPTDDTVGAPILAEVPELAAALDAARQIDRAVARLIDQLMVLQDHDLAERITGVPLEQWLLIVGRRTGTDRRMLMTTCDVLRRLPSLHAAFSIDATVSWAQLRSIVLQVHRLPRHLDDALDDGIARAIADTATAEPDALTAMVGWVIDDLRPNDAPRPDAPDATRQFFAMQPRLDGSGGRVWGDFHALGFATLDAALHDPPPSDSGNGGNGGNGGSNGGSGQRPDDPTDPDRRSVATAGTRRADRLLDLVERGSGHAGRSGENERDGSDDSADSRLGSAAESSRRGNGSEVTGRATGPRPQLLVRIGLSALLDRDQTPAALLTHLTGGRMWLDAATARRLVEERGADLRAIVLDDTGAVVGVGRRTRIAPEWLADTTLGLHDTCSAPGCQVAARVCDTDHAIPWHPHRPDAPLGRTDIDQLAPLCGRDNRAKERAGWRVEQSADGVRTWRHPRSGLMVETIPATRRPAPARAPVEPPVRVPEEQNHGPGDARGASRGAGSRGTDAPPRARGRSPTAADPPGSRPRPMPEPESPPLPGGGRTSTPEDLRNADLPF